VTVGVLADKLPAGRPVYGVTSLAGELYVLRQKEADQVEVYDVISCRLLRQLTVPNACGYSDMTSCEHHRCLYISDPTIKCVHRLDVGGGTCTQWAVDDVPSGLSVNSANNVLITCTLVRKIKEFSTDGDALCQVTLPDDVINPLHAIQTVSGGFLVCHGDDCDPLQRVCLVSADGRHTLTLRCHGGKPGSDTNQYKVARHLAIDANQYVFVADLNNWRVALLSSTLGYIRHVLTSEQFEWGPDRLCLDASRRRLYVAENRWDDGGWIAGRVLVFTI